MQCPTCAAAVPDGARFCPNCGSALGTTEERRIVTVLFADLVGFSGIAEHQDPEQTKRLIDRCFERLVAEVHAFGGNVDKILGDGILALFGAPIAHEDDAERAVRTGLRLIEIVHEFEGGDDLDLRVGINTGEVLVGTLAGTDYTAMGDVVNLAQRLQSIAEPGAVLVGESTHALTAAVIDYRPADEVRVKGREQSVTSWRAVAATAPPGARRRHRHDVCLVGRDTELQLTAAALHLAIADRQGVLLSITGDGGVGKSRLIDELTQVIRLAGDAAVLEGACVPYGEANVWWPIASALSNYLGVDPGTAADMARDMARAKAAELDIPATDIEEMVEVFVHLLGQPSTIDRLEPTAARMAVHAAVTGVLMRRTQHRPIVLVIDDLHWADPLLLDLLAHCVRALARHPFALVTAMRTGHDVEWPPASDRSTMVALHLQPLDREATDELARALLDDVPDGPLLEALHLRSGGNPLFLIELAALTGVGSSGAGDLPDSLRALIAARLDQLSTDERQMLDNAATLGTSGMVYSLERFAEGMGQHFDPSTLADLDDAGLLEVRGQRWRFRSDSVREAAYQTITKASRAQRHAGVATAMAGKAPLDELAHHAASAAELIAELGPVRGVPSTIREQAIDLLTQATLKAHDSAAHRQAARHATRALGLLDDSDPRRTQLLLLRAAALTEQRQTHAAHLDLDAVLTIAGEQGDLSLEGEARRLRGSLFHQAGNLDAARVELGLAVDLLRRGNRRDLLAGALRTRGFIELFGGSLADAAWYLGEAEPIFGELGDQRGLAWIEQHRAWLAFLSGDMAAARRQLVSAATTLGDLGDRNGVGWAFGLLAFVEYFERHFDEAERLADQVQRDAEQRGDEWAAGMMQVLRANLRLWQGRLDESHRIAEQARSAFRRLGDRFGLTQALASLVRSEVAMGRSAAAQRSIEELISQSDTNDQEPFPLMAAAGASMHRGDGALTVQLARRAIRQTEIRGGGAFEPAVVEAVGLLQTGEFEAALVLLEPVIDHPFAHSAAALAYALAGDPRQALEQADAVVAADGASYLDQVMASIAAGSAHARLGDMEQSRLWLEAATARALAVGDVVAIGLATRATQTILGSTHPAHDPRAALGAGWQTVVDGLRP